MIRYALACEQAHEFESWFPSSDAFDEQVARGLVRCPLCDSAKVEKRLMAPSVARTDRGPVNAPLVPVPDAPTAPAPSPQPQSLALLSEPERQVRELLRAMREHVLRHSDPVGDRFAEEARRMHYGEIEQRSIVGEATPDEARSLLEEGIEVLPLPVIPDDRN